MRISVERLKKVMDVLNILIHIAFLAGLLVLAFFSPQERRRHVAVLWPLDPQQTVVYIFPMGRVALVKNNTLHIYTEDSDATYVSAIRWEKENWTVRRIINHKYLVAWTNHIPQIRGYPSHLTNIMDILNALVK